MKSLSRLLRFDLALLVLLVCALWMWSCEGHGAFYGKLPPETRLSNVPPDSITSKNPRLTLSWIGDDADGFVVAYKYRWNFRLSAADTFQYKPWTTILNFSLKKLALVILGDESVAPKVYHYFSTLPPEGLDTTSLNALGRGDTLTIEGVRLFASNPDNERYPVHTSPNSGTFIFDSQDILNPHTFEIASIDNDGLVDPTPATIFFRTPQVAAPLTEIISSPLDTVLVLNNFTDTFTGAVFTYRGIDENSRTLDYQWVVDKDIWMANTGHIPWSDFSQSTTALVKAGDFPDPYAPQHRFYVRARNEFGSIDTTGIFLRVTNLGGGVTRVDTIRANRAFTTVYPAFARPGYTPKTLIINNSYDFDTLATVAQPNAATIEQYYRDLYNALGKVEGVDYDIFRVGALSFPGRGMLGNYNKVHFFADVVNDVNGKWSTVTGNDKNLGPARQGILTDYCNVGGKILFSGNNMGRTDQISANSDFYNKILHILVPVNAEAPPPGTRGAPPPVPDAFIGALGQTGTGFPDAPLDQTKLDTSWHGGLPYSWVYQLYGFGEIIYRYQAKPVPPVYYQNVPVGVKYLGITYDVFFLSFPLYYIEQSTAVEILRKVNEEFDSPR